MHVFVNPSKRSGCDTRSITNSLTDFRDFSSTPVAIPVLKRQSTLLILYCWNMNSKMHTIRIVISFIEDLNSDHLVHFQG